MLGVKFRVLHKPRYALTLSRLVAQCFDGVENSVSHVGENDIKTQN